MNKRIIIILAFTILLISGAVSAQDDRLPLNPPPSYYGAITVNGQPAPAGTTIIAKIGGEVRGSLTTEKLGYYGDDSGPAKLWIRGYQNEIGSTVTFYINGVAAQQTAELSEAGITNNVDLTFTGIPGLPSGASSGGGSTGGTTGDGTSGNGTTNINSTSNSKSISTPEVTQQGITSIVTQTPKSTEIQNASGALPKISLMTNPAIIVGVFALLIVIIAAALYFNRK